MKPDIFKTRHGKEIKLNKGTILKLMSDRKLYGLFMFVQNADLDCRKYFVLYFHVTSWNGRLSIDHDAGLNGYDIEELTC